MRVLDSLTPGISFTVGVVTGVPSLLYAAVTEDFSAVAVGSAVGLVTLGLAIWRSSNDSRVDGLLSRLAKAEQESDRHQADAIAAKAKAAELVVEMAALNARLKIQDDSATGR
jgi:hypothetical protein